MKIWRVPARRVSDVQYMIFVEVGIPSKEVVSWRHSLSRRRTSGMPSQSNAVPREPRLLLYDSELKAYAQHGTILNAPEETRHSGESSIGHMNTLASSVTSRSDPINLTRSSACLKLHKIGPFESGLRRL